MKTAVLKTNNNNFMEGKTMKAKRIISILITMVMVMLVSANVFAASNDISDYFDDEVGRSMNVSANVRMREEAERLLVMPALIYLKQADTGRTMSASNGDLNKFDDYNQRDFSKKQIWEMKVMEVNDILSGRPDRYGNLVIDAEDSITRAEFTKVIMSSLDALNIRVSNSYRGNLYFDDLEDDYGNEHWAAQYIQEAVEKNLIKGVGSNRFDPDEPISYQDATLIFIRIGREIGLSEYQIAEALDNLDYIDVDYNGEDMEWSFTKNTIYISLEDPDFDISSIMDGYNDTIEFQSSDRSYATISRDGEISAKKATGNKKVYITATDDYDNEDSVRVIITDDYSKIPDPEPSSEFEANQDYATLEVGDTLKDLEDYFNNTSGYSITYSLENTTYATISGSRVTGKKVGTVELTAKRSDGQRATMEIRVVDNSHLGTSDLNPTFQYAKGSDDGSSSAGNNNTNTLIVTIRGLDSSCEVKCNYSIENIDENSDGSMRQYRITGLYPDGGTDSIVMSIYQDGNLVDEDMYIYSTAD